jgi:hypothetical protein
MNTSISPRALHRAQRRLIASPVEHLVAKAQTAVRSRQSLVNVGWTMQTLQRPEDDAADAVLNLAQDFVEG